MRSPTALVLFSCFVVAQEPAPPGPPGTPAPEAAPVWRGDPTVLAGQCLDADGKPVPGAKVEVHLRDYRADRNDMVRATIADAEGRFRFEGLKALGEADWGWTFHYVVGRADGRALAVATIRGPRIPQDALQLVFGGAETVVGEVVGEQGKPIAGAQVWAWLVEGIPGAPKYNEIWTAEALVGWTARTDEKGEFRIEGLPEGAKIRLMSTHPVFAKTQAEAIVPDDLRITMEPGATIAGRVLFPDGKPVPFAKVQCQGVQQSSWAIARADADGFYRLESLPDEPYNVWVEAEDWTVTALDSFPVVAGEVAKAPDLVLTKGGLIVGKVVDAATDKGVKPGATGDVGLYGPSRPRSGAAIDVGEIGPDGTFTIRAAPGNNYVYIRCGAGWSSVGRGSLDVEVVEGEKVEVVFKVGKASERRR